MLLTDFSTVTALPQHFQCATPCVYSAAAEFRPTRHAWDSATELDARGRPPPKPLDAVLAAFAKLAPEIDLFVRTSTRPDELLAELRRKNIASMSTELADATWRTRLRR